MTTKFEVKILSMFSDRKHVIYYCKRVFVNRALHRLFYSLGSNPKARNLLWNYFTENFDVLHAKFAKSLSLFGSAVRSSVGGFTTFEKIEEVKAFFADKDTKEYARPLQQALEGAMVNAKWIQRDAAAVAEWVQKNANKFA